MATLVIARPRDLTGAIEPAPTPQFHAMDYLVYAHLQLAQDKEARAVVDEMLETKGYDPNVRGGPYAIAAGEARYMVEREDWKGAAALTVRPSKFAYVDAVCSLVTQEYTHERDRVVRSSIQRLVRSSSLDSSGR